MRFCYTPCMKRVSIGLLLLAATLGVVVVLMFEYMTIPSNEDAVFESLDDGDISTQIEWQVSGFLNSLDVQPTNVANLIIDDQGRLVATFSVADGSAYVAMSEDGEVWNSTEVPINFVRAMIQRRDGSYLLGGSASGDANILFESTDGLDWSPVSFTSQKVIPNEVSASVWDLLELPDGRVLIATDRLTNDPEDVHETLYFLSGTTLEPAGAFPGLGVLSVAQGLDGTLYAATEESDEHDDPDAAGQARVFRSDDDGLRWQEVGVPEGANRVYHLLVLEDGTLLAATGIRGEVLASTDRGESWSAWTHVPSAELPFGILGTLKEFEASRVYRVLVLDDNRVLVGTGNKAGDVFITTDGGFTWIETENTGPNNVVWALAQDPDSGRVWIGTGSQGGDILYSDDF